MESVFLQIQALEQVSDYSKHEQIVQGIINAIHDKKLSQGEMLPSVNSMVREFGFASKTIVKAYNDLKDRGLIESKKRLGYFVATEDTEQSMKVALLIYAFHPFQEVFYNAFRSTLGDNIQVDVYFHHNNIGIFKTILKNIRGKYAMYAVAPIPNPKTKKLLDKIPREKLVLVDRYEEMDGQFSHVTQEFEQATYDALRTMVDSIRKFENIILYFRPNSDYPLDVKIGFERFLKDFDLKGEVQEKYKEGMVRSNEAYFTIGDGDLWRLLKDCKKHSLNIGSDVGVLSYNDGPVKEIICGGITTFSTDFKMMGNRAAEFILDREAVQEIIPTVLIRRNSL